MSDSSTEQESIQNQHSLLHKLRLAVKWRTAFLLTVLPTVAFTCSMCIILGLIYLIPKFLLKKYMFITGLFMAFMLLIPIIIALMIIDDECSKATARLRCADYHQVQPGRRSLVGAVGIVSLFAANHYVFDDSNMEWAKSSQVTLYVWYGSIWLGATLAVWVFALGPMVWFSVKSDEQGMPDAEQQAVDLKRASPSEPSEQAVEAEKGGQIVDLEGSFVRVESIEAVGGQEAAAIEVS